MLYLILTGICFGTIGLFVNIIGNDVSTVLLVAIRLLSTAGLIMTYQFFRGKQSELRFDSREKFYYGLFGGVIGFGLTFSLYLKSLVLIPVSEAVFLHYVAFPFSTILYSSLFRGEKPSIKEILSLLGTVVGIVFIYDVGFGGKGGSLVGYSMALGSGVSYTAALIVLKELGKTKTTLQTLFWPALFGGLSLMPVVLAGGFTFAVSGNSLTALMGLVLISTLMGYSLFAKGLKETRAGLSSIVLIVVEPFSAVVFAILFLGESLTGTSILGGSLIITSGLLLYGVNKRSNRKKKTEMVD
ncbi:MAG: DMT family transporter [Candidatus Bipolaricaulota bacterium]